MASINTPHLPGVTPETNTQYTALTRRQPRRPTLNTPHLPGGSLGAQASAHRTYPKAASETKHQYTALTQRQPRSTALTITTMVRHTAFQLHIEGPPKAAPHNKELSHEFHVADTMLAYAVAQQPQPEGTQLEAIFKELQINLLTE